MTENDKAHHRAREHACRQAAAKADTPQAAASHNMLADQHRELANKGKRPTLHIVGNR